MQRLLEVKMVIYIAIFSGWLGSCVPTGTTTLQFISFENAPSLKIIESAHGLRGEISLLSIPMVYELKKENYILKIDIRIGIYGATGACLKGLDKNLKSLTIKGNKIANLNNPLENFCHLGFYSFLWESDQNKVLEVKLFNQNDELLGKEKIPFEIRSEKFLTIDSL